MSYDFEFLYLGGRGAVEGGRGGSREGGKEEGLERAKATPTLSSFICSINCCEDDSNKAVQAKPTLRRRGDRRKGGS